MAKAKKTAAKKNKKVAKKAAKPARKATTRRTSASSKKKGRKASAKTTAKKVIKKAAKKSGKKPAKSTKKVAPKRTGKKKSAGQKGGKPSVAKKPAAKAAIAKTAQAAKPVTTKAPKPPKAKAVAAPQSAASARAKNAFYITTAIAYPNGEPHIGHAYEAIATDALARFQRLDGKDVFFLTGTDEHGQKMIQTAQKENMTPLELATRNAARFKEMDQRLNISFDRFIRTSEKQHHAATQEIWKRMVANGDIYLDSYAGWYSVRDEAYYAEDETVVGEDKVRRGPQGTPVEWVEEKSYFFELSAYQNKLLALYESQPDFIGPDSRKNEVVSFVKSGLKDLSISRTTFDWGVKVPGDEEHVMYVWVDALTNY
ncbi:MAG: methionine--tRNA ligase, partial [Afipia sp.]